VIAALYVEHGGVYFDLEGVHPWPRARDARLYDGPWPVVAHPPCERWGRFWHGSTRKPHQYKLGDDDGCFAAALCAVRRWGGVLEHPEHSHAWREFGITPPQPTGWCWANDSYPAWTCRVEQGFYGHWSRKPTWLYASGGRHNRIDLPDLRWGRGEQRLHPVALAKHGYEKARRIGMVAMIGGKHKKAIRDRTPVEFRDALIQIASSACSPRRDAATPRAAPFVAAGQCDCSSLTPAAAGV
jgi:hypothetical protein